MRIRRRDLLRAGAGAVAGLTVNACSSGDPYSRDKAPVPGAEAWRRFEEKSIVTACGQCEASCGVRVRVVEGRAVRIDGDLDNPINRGGIGPRGVAGVQVVYDPDRIRQPLHRVNGELVPISWDDALAMLAERLIDLRDSGAAERLLILCGRERGMTRELWERFALAFGTPNFFDSGLRNGGGLRQANELMQGIADIPAYDWGDARLILSFGAGLLESSCQSVYLTRLTSHLRRGRSGDRARIVHVEPSFSRTAANADQWLSITPGTYGALALGLAHVLVRDGAYDKDFVTNHTHGFEAWSDAAGVSHKGFAEILRSSYPPDRVAEICGTTAAAIESLARELIETRPALAVIDPYTTQEAGGLQTAMAVLALNALLGGIQRPGGLVAQAPAPLAPWPDVELDDSALASLARAALVERNPFGAVSAAAIPAALLGTESPPVDTALIYYSNPCHAWPDPQRWQQALAAVPFVVSFSPFLDDTTAAVAHLVLPDHTFLERFEDAPPAPSIGTTVFGMRQPVIAPLYDTRSTADVIIELAREIGDSVADALSWKEFRFAFAQRVNGLQEAHRGSIDAPTSQAFFRELFRAGFWADDERDWSTEEPKFATDSGKFEFSSLRLRGGIERLAAQRNVEANTLLREFNYPDDIDAACLPHYRDDASENGSHPFILEAFKPGTYAEGSGANQPLLQELVTEPGARPWSHDASIAPATAQALGIRSGDLVEIQSATGSITVPVRVVDGVHPGSVRMPRGGGHSEFGRFARGRGANPMRLIAQRSDPIIQFPIVHGTRVSLKKVTT